MGSWAVLSAALPRHTVRGTPHATTREAPTCIVITSPDVLCKYWTWYGDAILDVVRYAVDACVRWLPVDAIRGCSRGAESILNRLVQQRSYTTLAAFTTVAVQLQPHLVSLCSTSDNCVLLALYRSLGCSKQVLRTPLCADSSPADWPAKRQGARSSHGTLLVCRRCTICEVTHASEPNTSSRHKPWATLRQTVGNQQRPSRRQPAFYRAPKEGTLPRRDVL